MAGKNNADSKSVSEKLGELTDAIKDCQQETDDKSDTQLSVNQQLGKLFPSIAPKPRSHPGESSTSTSAACASTTTKIDNNSANDNTRGIENFFKGKRVTSGRWVNRKKSKSPKSSSPSTVTAILKDIFFLTEKTDRVPKYDRRSNLAKEGYVKSAVRFTSDMDQMAIFSTIKEKFHDKFHGNVPDIQILKAYGTKLVSPNLDGEWNYQILKHQCGNGSMYVCPVTVCVNSDSEEEQLYEPTFLNDHDERTSECKKHLVPEATTARLAHAGDEKKVLIPRENAGVTCPICQKKVPSWQIEVHANECAENSSRQGSYGYAKLIWDVSPQDIPETDNELVDHARVADTNAYKFGGDVKVLRSRIQEDVSKLRRGIVEEEGICQLSIRRMQAWKDYVSYFKKSWNKHKTHYPVSVSFLGEAAVDTEALNVNFFLVSFL